MAPFLLRGDFFPVEVLLHVLAGETTDALGIIPGYYVTSLIGQGERLALQAEHGVKQAVLFTGVNFQFEGINRQQFYEVGFVLLAVVSKLEAGVFGGFVGDELQHDLLPSRTKAAFTTFGFVESLDLYQFRGADGDYDELQQAVTSLPSDLIGQTVYTEVVHLQYSDPLTTEILVNYAYSVTQGNTLGSTSTRTG